MKDQLQYVKDWPTLLNAEPKTSSLFKVMVVCAVHSAPALMGSHSNDKIGKKTTTKGISFVLAFL